MTKTFLVTPGNWFDLLRQARSSAETRDRLHLTLTDADGNRPLGGVALEELRAIHQTLGSWWAMLGSDERPASVGAGDYDRFLAGSRALLKDKAEVALGSRHQVAASAPLLVTFPDLHHPLLADPRRALAFFKSFVALQRAPSLSAWVRDHATADNGIALCESLAWLRVLLQKVAVEDEQPEALACLRTVYGAGDAARNTLLRDERQLLEQCGLPDLQAWSRSLGLDRPARTRPEVGVPPPRPLHESRPPQVTVLVPSHCHEAFIEASLESVLAQTYAAFSLLVVDDGSSDRTVERAARIRDPRLQILVNDKNLGLGDSVLQALDNVTTPYVALLNSDDIFYPERLERCLAILKSSESIQVVATGLMPIDANGDDLGLDNVRRLFDGADVANWIQWFADTSHVREDADLLAELIERNFLITSSNVVCRTDFLHAHDDDLRGLKYCFDWQIFLDAAVDRTLAFVPDKLVGYRLHSSNTVWFDAARRAIYALEVNRVLAHALRQAFEQSSGQDGDLARLLELITRAAKHSDANGLALTAAALVGNRTLVESASHSEIVRDALQVMLGSNQPQAASDRQRDDGVANAARALAELSREEVILARESERRMQSSAEWLIGHILWKRAHLSRIGVPAVRGLQWLRDRSNRWRLTLGRVARRYGRAGPHAVVAACWSFPIHSQTFVYQEVQSLAWAGLDYHLFCWETNAKRERQTAFDAVWRRRVVLRADNAISRRDRDHYLRTRPERVEALLGRIAEATGFTRDQLMQQPVLMLGFTFTRHVELSGADYLHTYFFYDQSFMALMAAYLLRIPRGITAYADHMLEDYRFKCVALHLELADIVVATSERIRRELSGIGSGRFDSKILVKSNGIDITRFPYVDVVSRLARGRAPELISVSRVEPKKGLIYLVEALAILNARGISLRLNIVGGADPQTPGSADYLRELLARIDTLELGDRVVLHGVKTQAELVPLLARSQVFVAPYVEVESGDKDGIPTAVLEAMSTGLPIVATDAGSILEVVTDDVEGLLAPQRDAVALADAIEKVLTDSSTYARMAEAARRRVVSEFDVRVTERALHERIRAHLARSSP